MAPPFALPPPDFPLPAYVRRVEKGIFTPDKWIKQAVLPGLYMLPGVMGGRPKVKSLSLITFTTAAANTITGPSEIQSGDLLILGDRAGSMSGVTSAVPVGFTKIVEDDGEGFDVQFKQICSVKVSDGSEADAAITGMNGEFTVSKILFVFRGNTPISLATIFDPNSQSTSGNPSPQIVAASARAAPLVVIGAYGASKEPPVSINSRTMLPAADDEVNRSGFGSNLFLAYKIFNSDPVNVTVDMGDEGDTNVLQSFGIEVA